MDIFNVFFSWEVYQKKKKKVFKRILILEVLIKINSLKLYKFFYNYGRVQNITGILTWKAQTVTASITIMNL